MIKAIIFDVGGVMVDFTNDEHYYPYLSRISGASVKRVKRVVEDSPQWGKLDKDEITQREFDLKIARDLRIHENQVLWYETYVKEGRIDKRVMSIVAKLSKLYKVAYLSNVDLSRYTHTLKLMKQYFKLFDYKFASCYVHRRKPDKEVYLYAVRRMRIRPEEAVFVDNQIENVVGAKKAGLKAVWFKNSTELRRDLKKLGVEL